MFHVTNNWFANSFLYLWVTCLVRLLPLFLIFSASRSQHWRCGGPRLCSTRQTHMNLALSICVLHQSLCNQFVCSCPRRRCCCCDGSIIESKVCHNACSLWWCSLDCRNAVDVCLSDDGHSIRLVHKFEIASSCFRLNRLCVQSMHWNRRLWWLCVFGKSLFESGSWGQHISFHVGHCYLAFAVWLRSPRPI